MISHLNIRNIWYVYTYVFLAVAYPLRFKKLNFIAQTKKEFVDRSRRV